MNAYILSNTDLKIKDVFPFDEYEFKDDIDFKSKSSVIAPKKPNVLNDDFVICKDGNDVVFSGIVNDASSGEDTGAYSLSLSVMEALFDRQIFIGNEALISSTGIEDFIVSEINSNWVSSGDARLDRPYISASATTHTRISASVSTIGSVQDGVYNLKTFLGNAKELYGIRLSFSFASSSITIRVWKDSSPTLSIDTTVSDITNLVETYTVKALAKLIIHWYNGTTTTIGTLYLKTDRTITQDGTDPNRADGTVKSMYIEAPTMSEAYEKAKNEFASNSYAHKVTFDLKKDSRVYPSSELYVGRKVTLRTKTFTKTSIVTEVSKSDEAFVSLVFGKLKVTLIDKLRG